MESMTQAARRPPHLSGLPLLGSALAFNRDQLGHLQRVAATCGDNGSFNVGPLHFVLINAPALVEELYLQHADDTEKGPLIQSIFRPALGDSLFTSEGDLHRRQRQLLVPRFAAAELERHTGHIVVAARRHATAWATAKKPFDLLAAAGEMARESLAAMLFSDATQLGATTELGRAFTIARTSIDYALAHPLYPPSSVPTPRNVRYKRAGHTVRAELDQLISRHAYAGVAGDLLTLLRDLRHADGTSMPRAQLVDELTVILGAHEIIAVTLTWAIAELAAHPDVYQRLLDEVDNVLQGEAPTLRHLERLRYTRRVYQEVLRLRPPTPGLIRRALRPFTLGGRHIAAGNTLTAVPYLLHRRADAFPEPDRFDPERFLPERTARLAAYTYMPFGVGERSCLGEHLAWLEGPLALATWAQAVRFERPDNAPVVPEVTFNIQPRGGLAVIARPRAS
jgi:cytochrome P450